MDRNPALVWLLTIFTFGAYGVWWVYKVNEGLRTRGELVRPAISALAVSWGVFLTLPPFWCAATTAQRVRNRSRPMGLKGPNPLVAVVLVLVVLTCIPYIQWHVNRLEQQERSGLEPSDVLR